MQSKLTREELRIIEQTKKEGEEAYGKNADTQMTDSADPADRQATPRQKSRTASYILLVLLFLLMAFVAKVIFGWFAQTIS